MNFKVIVYNCGSSYVYITNSDKRILKNPKRCPQCGSLKKHVVIICESCGVKMIERNPLSWQRKKRCNECRLTYQQEASRKQQRLKAKKRTETVPVQNVALQTSLKRVALRKFYGEMDRVFELPVVDTPVLDNLIAGYDA